MHKRHYNMDNNYIIYYWKSVLCEIAETMQLWCWESKALHQLIIHLLTDVVSFIHVISSSMG